MNQGSVRKRLIIGLAAVAVIAAACSSTGSSAAPSAGASGAAVGNITVGISNPGAVGNGWREAMICSAKAQAVKQGNVTGVTVLSEKTDANARRWSHGLPS